MTKPQSAADVFINLIVAFLAPMFLSVAGGDINFARAAAIETINAFRVRSNADLLSVAQIIAFGLAALGSLSLSMADDLSTSMVIRLRANAVSANRASEQCRRALLQPCFDTAAPVPPQDDDMLPDAAAIAATAEQARKQAAETNNRLQSSQPASPPPQPISATTTNPVVDAQSRIMWASAMADVAAEVAAGIPNLPPAQRREASIRAAALSNVANELLAEADGERPLPSNQQPPNLPV